VNFLFDVAMNGVPWDEYIGDFAWRVASSSTSTEAPGRVRDFAIQEVNSRKMANVVLRNCAVTLDVEKLLVIERARILLEREFLSTYRAILERRGLEWAKERGWVPTGARLVLLEETS
jgi:hypothetical protein